VNLPGLTTLNPTQFLSNRTGVTAQRRSRGDEMKDQDRYLKCVLWSEEDQMYIGYCPGLFPWGGVCHAKQEQRCYEELCSLVLEELEQLERDGASLPAPATRPMREAVPA